MLKRFAGTSYRPRRDMLIRITESASFTALEMASNKTTQRPCAGTNWPLRKSMSLLHYAEASAYGRRLGELRCADVMARKAGSDGLAMPWDQQLGPQEQVARQEQYLIELLPMFFEGGHPYLRIVDAERRLVGIITQADLLRALQRSRLLV